VTQPEKRNAPDCVRHESTMDHMRLFKPVWDHAAMHAAEIP